MSSLGVSVGVDYVALSFCREASDIETLRRVLGEQGSQARVIAKIEDQHAVSVIDDIIEKCDAIMVARGDLGHRVSNGRTPNHPATDGHEVHSDGPTGYRRNAHARVDDRKSIADARGDH